MASTSRPQQLLFDPAEPLISTNALDKKQLERHQVEVVAPYTPFDFNISGTSGGFTLGAGAYDLARFKRVGPIVDVEFLYYFGAAGFVPGGNTVWTWPLPIIPRLADLPATWSQKMIGTVKFNTGVIEQVGVAEYINAGTRRFQIVLHGAAVGQAVTGTIPGKAAGAFLEGSLHYECAY